MNIREANVDEDSRTVAIAGEPRSTHLVRNKET